MTTQPESTLSGTHRIITKRSTTAMIPTRSRTVSHRLPLLFIAALLLALLAAPGGIHAQESSSAAPAAIELDGDGDGLMDEQELQIGTDPNKYDTDGDGLSDGSEASSEGWGTNPLKADTDGDGANDGDKDGLIDEEELQIGTDPNDADSDNDRLSDGFEVREFGTNPLAADSDEDGLGDGDELEVFKTDALDADTDGDGYDDATEIDAGSDPRDPKSLPIRDAQPDEDAKPTPAPTTAKPAAQLVKALPSTGTGAAIDASSDNAPRWLILATGLLLGLIGVAGVRRHHVA
ncbi:MAG: MSCRAMM family adhesin SdrC [Chloroflexota bacterium]|nr:MSCRAMM family adhesin SdrC [Chloroflexota bacterium]